MHELAIMTRVLDVALEYAEVNNVKKIRAINLEAGAISGIVPRFAQMFFDHISKGTIAENALIKIENIPAKMACRSCGLEADMVPIGQSYSCLECGSQSMQIVSGRGYKVMSIEVE